MAQTCKSKAGVSAGPVYKFIRSTSHYYNSIFLIRKRPPSSCYIEYAIATQYHLHRINELRTRTICHPAYPSALPPAITAIE